jgi:hypothetical protein
MTREQAALICKNIKVLRHFARGGFIECTYIDGRGKRHTEYRTKFSLEWVGWAAIPKDRKMRRMKIDQRILNQR